MDVIGFGLANIDLVARVKDDFLHQHHIPKGGERVLDHLGMGRLRAALTQFEAMPGGCVANTLCGLSVMGIDTRFYGKIGHDEFESLYRASFHDYRVAYDVAAAQEESSQCIVFITPDGERSFAYSESASFALNDSDIDWNAVARAQLLYAEVYACDFARSVTLFERLCDQAKHHGIPLYIKIIEGGFARRFADLLQAQSARGAISLIVGNSDNLPRFMNTTAPTQTREALKTWPCPMLMTAANRGGTYFENGHAQDFSTDPIEAPKNSSGAGDQFMAGFIAAQLDKKPLEDCLAFGARTARAILTHHQPRPPLSGKSALRF